MDKSDPLVSVIMPVYNSALFLTEAINSILSQTYSNFELLIFNDGSTDKSLEIINSFSDKRIVLAYNGENTGYVKHLNDGIKMAKGKYIARMDADDISLHNRFETQVRFLEQNKSYTICGSHAYIFGRKNSYLNLPTESKEIKKFLLYNTAFCHPSVMIRKNTLIENNLFYDQNLMPAEDSDLWKRLAFFGDMKNIKEPLIKYRVHNDNISFKKRDNKIIDNIIQSRKNYINTVFNSVINKKKETEILYNLFYPNINIIQIQDLKEISTLIQNINNSAIDKIYEFTTTEIINLLSEKFTYLCTCSTFLGLNVFYIYLNFKPKKNNFLFSIKLFLKSLISYRGKT